MGNKKETIQKIITAARQEFGEKGFEQASTNQIYQKAGLSKGVIFKYFPSKAVLFYEVFRDALETMVEEMNTIDYQKFNNLYDKIVYATMWKLEYSLKHPHATNVILEAFSHPPQEVFEEIKSYFALASTLSTEHFFQEIDLSHFKSEFTKEMVMRNIRIGLNGLLKTYESENITLDFLEKIREESFMFIKILIKGMEK